MNCALVRERLAGWLYGDLRTAEAAQIESHLKGCAECRRECAALEKVQRALGVLPEPGVSVDLPRLYRAAAQRQARRLARWRRLAFTACAASLLVAAVALATRLELRFEPDRLTLQWGTPPAVEQAVAVVPAPTPPAPNPVRIAPEVEAQLRLLSRLIHALAEDVRALERREQQDAVQFEVRLEALRQQELQHRADIERVLNGLYLLSANKGG
jgi:anti-sigma factor RsiW